MNKVVGFTLREYVYHAHAIGLDDNQIAKQVGLTVEELAERLNADAGIGAKRAEKVEEKKQKASEIKEQIKEKKAKGYTNAAVAEQLDISEATVVNMTEKVQETE